MGGGGELFVSGAWKRNTVVYGILQGSQLFSLHQVHLAKGVGYPCQLPGGIHVTTTALPGEMEKGQKGGRLSYEARMKAGKEKVAISGLGEY